jgi:hypothetical protein
MITAKIKRLNDKAIWAKARADDLKDIGDRDLCCREFYSDKIPHEWICYKRKILREFFIPRTRGVKTWFECKVCGIEMILFKDNNA